MVKKTQKKDSLVESLKEELGIVEEVSQVEEVPQVPREEKKTEPKKTRDTRDTSGTHKTRSKKYLEKLAGVDRDKNYKLNEAIELAQKSSYTDFIGTVEVHINTAQKNLRGLASLPFAAGKKLVILAFGPSTSLGIDKEFMDGVIVGDDNTIEEINKGKINFDVVVTTPEWMPKLAKVSRILGPRGLMPNPKSGTITDNLNKAVSELQTGKVEYKTEPNGKVIHMAVGKVNQDPTEISANIKALYNTLGRSRVKKITLSPTMGPGVKVDISSI